MPRIRTLLLCAVLGLSIVACGDDDDDGEASTEATTGGTGAGVGADAGGEAASCRPVGTDLEASADETVDIQLTEYSFTPSTVTVPAGTITFVATNAGGENHELAFLPDGTEVPLTAEGAPDEDALGAAGAFELEAFPPGGSCNATYELEAGDYLLFCIVEASDGATHASKGMLGQLTVS
jgi:plastocyanin